MGGIKFNPNIGKRARYNYFSNNNYQHPVVLQQKGSSWQLTWQNTFCFTCNDNPIPVQYPAEWHSMDQDEKFMFVNDSLKGFNEKNARRTTWKSSNAEFEGDLTITLQPA